MIDDLWAGADPLRLIPGNVAEIRVAADQLSTLQSKYNDLFDSIKQTQNGQLEQSWEGDAADTARDVLDEFVKPWESAADAHLSAKNALEVYAEDLSKAQSQASDAVEEYRRGDKKTTDARKKYEQADPITRGPFVDPGDSIRKAARGILADARATVADAAEKAARAIDGAADLAPDGPGFWEQMLGGLADLAEMTFPSGSLISAAIGGQPGDDKRDFLERVWHRQQDNWFFDLFRDDTNLDFDDVLWEEDLQGTTDFRDQLTQGEFANTNLKLTIEALLVGGALTGFSENPPQYNKRAGLWIVTLPESFTDPLKAVGSGGFTVGNVFFAPAEKDTEDAALLMHEWKHSREYARSGGPFMFLTSYFLFQAVAGEDPYTQATNNPFEQAANLRDGGYGKGVDYPEKKRQPSGDPFVTLSELRKR